MLESRQIGQAGSAVAVPGYFVHAPFGGKNGPGPSASTVFVGASIVVFAIAVAVVAKPRFALSGNILHKDGVILRHGFAEGPIVRAEDAQSRQFEETSVDDTTRVMFSGAIAKDEP